MIGVCKCKCPEQDKKYGVDRRKFSYDATLSSWRCSNCAPVSQVDQKETTKSKPIKADKGDVLEKPIINVKKEKGSDKPTTEENQQRLGLTEEKVREIARDEFYKMVSEWKRKK